MADENKTSGNNDNAPDYIFEVVYFDKQASGLHIVGEYTDRLESIDVANKYAAMDDAEKVLIYVSHGDGKFIGAVPIKDDGLKARGPDM